MPVDDHAIHPRTQIDDTFRWGCHNRPPFAAGYWAPNRIYVGLIYSENKEWIPHTATTTCQNDIRATDSGCRGCKHIED